MFELKEYWTGYRSCFVPSTRAHAFAVAVCRTGHGKTHILEKFLRDQRSGSEFGRSARVPIACVQMPPYPHERDFYQEVLTALGTVVPDGMSVVTLRHRVRVLARQLQLRMLVVDEIHGMLREPSANNAFSSVPFAFWLTTYEFHWFVSVRTKQNRR